MGFVKENTVIWLKLLIIFSIMLPYPSYFGLMLLKLQPIL